MSSVLFAVLILNVVIRTGARRWGYATNERDFVKIFVLPHVGQIKPHKHVEPEDVHACQYREKNGI